MDPYVKIKIGSFTQVSKVHKDAGKNPQWNDVCFEVVTGADADLQ